MNVDDPQSVEYYSILRSKWLYGPEPPVLRGIVGGSAFVLKNDIYMVSGWEHISKRYVILHLALKLTLYLTCIGAPTLTRF